MGIAGLPAGVPYPHAFDGSLWTLWLECRCYIALAVIGAFGVLHHARWIVPALTIALIAALLASLVEPTMLRSGPLAVYFWQWMDSAQLNLELWTCFFVGASTYLFRRFVPLSPLFALAALFGFIVLTPTPLEPLATALLLSYTMLTVGFRLGVRQAVRLQRVGDLSYGTYIYAFPVQQFLAQLGFTALPVGLYGALGAVCTLPVAYASYHLVEKPFLRLKSLGIKSRKETKRPASKALQAPMSSGISEVPTVPVVSVGGRRVQASSPDIAEVPTVPVESVGGRRVQPFEDSK